MSPLRLLCAALALAAGLPALHADVTVPNNTNILSGQTSMVTDPGKIGTAGSVQVQSGGKAAFVAGGEVRLLPGFHAFGSASFHAVRDLNFAGLGSLADTDFDGLPDEWEMLHFGNLTSINGLDDFDGDGVSNAMEYYAGTNPKVNEVTATLPANVQVVLRLMNGKYQGVKTDWSVIAVP